MNPECRDLDALESLAWKIGPPALISHTPGDPVARLWLRGELIATAPVRFEVGA